MVRISTGLLVGWIALTIAAVANADDGGRSAYVTASKYFEAEEYEAALPYFKDAYTKSGRRPATIFGLAQCLRALKRYDEAIPLFRAYLETDPENAAEVRETLGLLEEIAAKRRRAEAEAERKREAKAAAERARKAEAEREAAAKREAEREAAAREAEERARRAAEEAIAAQPPPPPAVTTTTGPEDDDGSIVESPVFWLVTGAAVVGGAIAVGVIASSNGGYGGSTDVVLSPLGGRR